MRAKDTVSAMKLLPERSSRIIRPRQLKPRGWIRIVEASYDVVLLVGCASLTRTLFAGQHISGRNLHDVSRTKGQKKVRLTHALVLLLRCWQGRWRWRWRWCSRSPWRDNEVILAGIPGLSPFGSDRANLHKE